MWGPLDRGVPQARPSRSWWWGRRLPLKPGGRKVPRGGAANDEEDTPRPNARGIGGDSCRSRGHSRRGRCRCDRGRDRPLPSTAPGNDEDASGNHDQPVRAVFPHRAPSSAVALTASRPPAGPTGSFDSSVEPNVPGGPSFTCFCVGNHTTSADADPGHREPLHCSHVSAGLCGEREHLARRRREGHGRTPWRVDVALRQATEGTDGRRRR